MEPLSPEAMAMARRRLGRPAVGPLLWLAVAVGHLVGRRLFTRMDVARYERAVLSVLVFAALSAVTSALT